MNKNELHDLHIALDALAVFRPLLGDPVFSALHQYLREPTAYGYGKFVSRLYEANGGNLTAYVRELCYACETVYLRLVGSGKEVPTPLAEGLAAELSLLTRVAELTPAALTEPLADTGYLPAFIAQPFDLTAGYMARVAEIGRYGYGQYMGNRMFYLGEDGALIPVKHPDPVTLDSLVDYESERQRVVDNTKALLAGKPAANILLTGDAGTGKSSTVKAVCNAFYEEGLRLIQLRKEQLRLVPQLLDELAPNPLKFILFIDDLSFLQEDDDFSSLKGVLEGSASVRSANVVIYATSNRRHIVREKFSDREGDDVHRNDAMQEMISLSNRFGMHITFQRPDKATFLHIVRKLAQQHGIACPTEQLEAQAEQFALERGGRSARLAQQFIDRLLSQ